MRTEWIEVATLASAAPLRLALHTLGAPGSGPTVGLVAGIHGDEVPPVEVVRRVVGTLQGQAIRGCVRVLPVANPLAFAALTRHTPEDMQNLNRLFPGDSGGWLSEQLAAAIVARFLPGLDALLDLHAGGLFPTVDYVYITNNEALSRSFGFPVLYRTARSFAGTLGTVAAEQSIPTVVAELGGGQLADAEYIECGVRGVLGALRHLGLIEGRPEPAVAPLITERLETLRPRHGGLLVPAVGVTDLGRVVPRGTLLGEVFSPYTFESLERFEAPFERTLLMLLRGAVSRVQPGDYAFMLGQLPPPSVLSNTATMS